LVPFRNTWRRVIADATRTGNSAAEMLDLGLHMECASGGAKTGPLKHPA
jgi:hypothetical protein